MKNHQPLLSDAVFNYVSSDREIMTWHYRLGRPSFSYLRRLFPSLFHNKTRCLFSVKCAS